MVTLVRAAALTHFSEVMKGLGGDPDSCMRRVGLRPSLVSEQDQMLDSSLVAALLEEAVRATGCESFGLRMAQTRQLSNFGAVSFLLMHQPTLRHVLLTLIEHIHSLNEALVLQLEEAGEYVILREDFLSNVPRRQSMELAIGVLFRTCEAVLGDRWRPQSVCFSHSAPLDAGPHKRMFRCRVDFGADFSGIVCRAADLNEPPSLADPTLVRYARTVVESAPKGRSATTGEQVRKAIHAMLPSGGATCKSVAQGLGRSVRTLQRELDAEGLSFTDLLEEARQNLARRYVSDTRYSIGQIAALLGYGSHSTFTRWFTSNFGKSPEAWRHSLREG